MAVTKKFQELVSKVIGSNVGELLRQIGAESVKMAYTAKSGESAQYALDNLPDAWRDPLATWFRARGLIVQRKAVGSSRYLVGETDDAGVVKLVKSVKAQAKALEECALPVLKDAAQTVRAEKKVKSPDESVSVKVRANKAAEKAVASLKKVDPAAAVELNDRLTRNAGLVLGTAEGAIELTADEAAELVAHLMALRIPALRRAA